MKPIKTEVLYRTPWCEMVAKTVNPGEEPWYSLRGPDYNAVIAVTEDQRILAVRQYRPAIEQFTIELPSGNIDPGETPEASARRELREETGFEAAEWTALGPMYPDVGRLGTRVWYFLATGAKPVENWTPEPGVELLSYSVAELIRAIQDGTFNHALHVAPFIPAMLCGKLRIEPTSK